MGALIQICPQCCRRVLDVYGACSDCGAPEPLEAVLQEAVAEFEAAEYETSTTDDEIA